MYYASFLFLFSVFTVEVSKMKNKISAVLTDSSASIQKNKKKRKEICPDPNEGKVLVEAIA